MYDELIADWAVDQLREQHENPFFLAVGFVQTACTIYRAERVFCEVRSGEDRGAESSNK